MKIFLPGFVTQEQKQDLHKRLTTLKGKDNDKKHQLRAHGIIKEWAVKWDLEEKLDQHAKAMKNMSATPQKNRKVFGQL